MSFTMQQAADAVKKHKSTIFKAIKNGTLSAKKDKNGNFIIDPSELFRVYPSQQVDGENQQHATAGKHHATDDLHLENALLKAEIDKLKEILAMKDNTIAMLESSVTAWQGEAKANRLLLEHHSTRQEKKKKGFFARVLNSSDA